METNIKIKEPIFELLISFRQLADKFSKFIFIQIVH